MEALKTMLERECSLGILASNFGVPSEKNYFFKATRTRATGTHNYVYIDVSLHETIVEKIDLTIKHRLVEDPFFTK
jgi:hypothetical protein